MRAGDSQGGSQRRGMAAGHTGPPLPLPGASESSATMVKRQQSHRLYQNLLLITFFEKRSHLQQQKISQQEDCFFSIFTRYSESCKIQNFTGNNTASLQTS